MKYLAFVLIFITVSCNLFTKEEEKSEIVATVGSKNLTNQELKKILSVQGIPSTGLDSVSRAKRHIVEWVSKELIFQKAILNTKANDAHRYEEMAEQYRIDIYTSSYLQELSNKSIDTIISEEQYRSFYEELKTNYKLAEPLFKIRYIHVLESNQNLQEIKKRFTRFNENDFQIIDSLSLQFIPFYLNDTTWVKASQVYMKLPLDREVFEKNRKRQGIYTIKDKEGKGVFFIKIVDEIKQGDTMPFEFAKKYIRQIILNKRKKKFINMLQRDIVSEAIDENEVFIYDY